MKLCLLSTLFCLSALADTGWSGDSFKPCPDKPNCVSSTEPKQSDRYIKPLEAHDLVLNKIRSYIEENKRWRLVSETEDYLHVTEESSFFGFIDDVEFKLDKGKLHFKSSSRKGYYDFGVNRERIERLREYLE